MILARFILIVRTFLTPWPARVEMPARKFLVYNIIGAVLRTDGILLLGYASRAGSSSSRPTRSTRTFSPVIPSLS